jgi:putative ABC transport system substrate-binding protein
MIRRRDFITLLGGTAAWPVVARAQRPAMPVIGLLSPASPDAFAHYMRAFRLGLKDSGYVEGENVAIDYRWAEGQYDRLPALAAELVRRPVAMIAATGGPSSALVAKAATTTIPIVFNVGEDPVRLGLVASLARPGGNLTGINFFSLELVAKRLGLIRELMSGATRIAVLVNPANPVNAETTTRELQAPARDIGLQIKVLRAASNSEINAAFATLVREQLDAVFVGGDAFFTSRRVQLAVLAARHAVPAIYPQRDFPEAGGLMSYGASLADTYRQLGVYAGRILKGAKPADLPVEQASKFELVINAETAKALGLDVPATLLARADEVIE